TPAGRTIEAGLEGVALAAAQPLRQAPIGAAAAQREAHHGIRREVIIEARRTANGAGRQIMAADDGYIPRRAISAALGTGPCRPAWLIDRRERRSRLLEHRGIGERNRRRHRFALGCEAERRGPRFAVARKAKRRLVGAANPATAVDEGIEHQVEKLVGELEGDLLRARRGFPGELVECCGEVAASQTEERHECRRQRTAAIAEILERASAIA